MSMAGVLRVRNIGENVGHDGKRKEDINVSLDSDEEREGYVVGMVECLGGVFGDPDVVGKRVDECLGKIKAVTIKRGGLVSGMCGYGADG